MYNKTIAILYFCDNNESLQILDSQETFIKLTEELNSNGFIVHKHSYLINNILESDIEEVFKANKYIICIVNTNTSKFVYELFYRLLNQKLEYIFIDHNDNTIQIPKDLRILNFNDKYILYYQQTFFVDVSYISSVCIEKLLEYLNHLQANPVYKKRIQLKMHDNKWSNQKIQNTEDVDINIEINNSIVEIILESENIMKINEAEKKIFTSFEEHLEAEVCDKYYKEIHMSDEIHIKKSVQYIKDCFDKYGTENVFLSFNGGKDCTVLLHLTLAVLKMEFNKNGNNLLCLYVKDPDQFQELDSFINEITFFYGLKIVIVVDKLKEALKSILNINPNLKACLMGTRRMDPFSQNLNHFQMTDTDWPSLMRVNPLLDWNYGQIWDYLLNYKVPYCHLYNDGYTSLGNVDNTEKNSSLVYFDNGLNENIYLPAYKLLDGSQERKGRK